MLKVCVFWIMTAALDCACVRMRTSYSLQAKHWVRALHYYPHFTEDKQRPRFRFLVNVTHLLREFETKANISSVQALNTQAINDTEEHLSLSTEM